MNLGDAIERIEEIHAQVAKGEVFRGYRPLPVGLAGVVGLLAGVVQPGVLAESNGVGFLAYWLAVAVFNLALNGAVMIAAYRREPDAFARRHTRRVVAQFLPCLVAGGAISLAFPAVDPGLVRLLPGIWALVFGLGMFASRPYLPRATGWVALFYLAAGIGLLGFPFEELSRAGLANGLAFGVGQLATAAVLHADLPRVADE